jgi:hypothetical protein
MHSKDAVWQMRTTKHTMCEELRFFSKEFYATGILYLMQRRKKCVDNGDCAEIISAL